MLLSDSSVMQESYAISDIERSAGVVVNPVVIISDQENARISHATVAVTSVVASEDTLVFVPEA